MHELATSTLGKRLALFPIGFVEFVIDFVEIGNGLDRFMPAIATHAIVDREISFCDSSIRRISFAVLVDFRRIVVLVAAFFGICRSKTEPIGARRMHNFIGLRAFFARRARLQLIDQRLDPRLRHGAMHVSVAQNAVFDQVVIFVRSRDTIAPMRPRHGLRQRRQNRRLRRLDLLRQRFAQRRAIDISRGQILAYPRSERVVVEEIIGSSRIENAQA